ncbi:HEPN domain-containing protein [Candidatus Gottesmanbacteria bacterium]|nr:HEPN domain-containing protein [Candidatus Gottesmanbacteria bacterium]
MKKTKPADWLFFADSDFTLAKKALEEHIFHLVCFHTQQAAEKLLKAALIARGEMPPKTHALRELYLLVVKYAPELEAHFPALKRFDRYYMPTRYPDALPGSLPEGLPVESDAWQAIADAEALFGLIRPLLETKA